MPLARTLRARANGAAAASIRLLAYGSRGSPPANKPMEPSSVQSPSVLPAGGSSAAPLVRPKELQDKKGAKQ
jgi:hypothetical protein